MGLLILGQKFLILAVTLQLGFSYAKEVVETPQLKAERILNETMTDLRKLVIRYNNASNTLDRRAKQPPPESVSNILEFINNYQGIKDLRESLDEVWPKFWKVSQREECAKLLDKKIEDYVKKFDGEVKKDYDRMISMLQRSLIGNEERLHNIADNLRRNHPAYVKNCAKSGDCKMKYGQWEDVIHDVVYVEQVLNGFDKRFKDHWEDQVKDNLNYDIVSAIEKCADE